MGLFWKDKDCMSKDEVELKKATSMADKTIEAKRWLRWSRLFLGPDFMQHRLLSRACLRFTGQFSITRRMQTVNQQEKSSDSLAYSTPFAVQFLPSTALLPLLCCYSVHLLHNQFQSQFSVVTTEFGVENLQHLKR